MKYKKCYLTGCDSNTEWQLPWFLENWQRDSGVPILIADFGMSEEMISHLHQHPTYMKRMQIFTFDSPVTGWFKKPRAIWAATRMSSRVCWLDTDCQIDGKIDTIWDHFQPNMLNMVKDRPWTERRPENGDWYNSGVVMTDRNEILRQWMEKTESDPDQGDQEVLHYMLTPIEKVGKINPLPHKYNTLRIDYIDNVAVPDPIVIHHTGHKGNEKIREMMRSTYA